MYTSWASSCTCLQKTLHSDQFALCSSETRDITESFIVVVNRDFPVYKHPRHQDAAPRCLLTRVRFAKTEYELINDEGINDISHNLCLKLFGSSFNWTCLSDGYAQSLVDHKLVVLKRLLHTWPVVLESINAMDAMSLFRSSTFIVHIKYVEDDDCSSIPYMTTRLCEMVCCMGRSGYVDLLP